MNVVYAQTSVGRVVLEPKGYAIVAYRSEKEAVRAMREPTEHQYF